MPFGGQILDLQIQDGVPCIWFLVNENLLEESRIFRTYNTGQDICHSGTYIGTYQACQACQACDGDSDPETLPFIRKVYHVFEVLIGGKSVCGTTK